MECRASGNPPPEVIWIRSDGTAVGDVPGLRQVLSNGNLVFPPFRAEDYRQEVHAQVYACLAKNQIGSIISRDVHVRAGKFRLTLTNILLFDLRNLLWYICQEFHYINISLKKHKFLSTTVGREGNEKCLEIIFRKRV